jgi:hypothetical protein
MTSLAFAEVTIAIRTLVALVYAAAAVGKMRHWAAFHGVIANYRLLPDFWVAPVAYSLPPFEAVLGAALFLGLFPPWPEVAAATLLVLFAIAMGINLLRGRRHIDCGCFQSSLKQTLSWILVVRNGVMALLLGLAMSLPGGTANPWVTMEGLLVGGVLFLILQSLNILWSIVPAWRRAAGFASRSSP